MKSPIHAIAIAALLSIPAAPAAAALPAPEVQLAKLIEGRTAGKPVDCIHLDLRAASVTIPRTAIAYKDGRTWYVSRFEGGCPELDPDAFIITSTPTTQVCRGDIVRVGRTPPTLLLGTCVMGDFTPYTKPR
jgi:hypothetical protein